MCLVGDFNTISHPKNIDFLFSNPRFDTFSGGQFNLKYFLVIFLDLFGFVLFLKGNAFISCFSRTGSRCLALN